jgi:hypothetical protein
LSWTAHIVQERLGVLTQTTKYDFPSTQSPAKGQVLRQYRDHHRQRTDFARNPSNFYVSTKRNISNFTSKEPRVNNPKFPGNNERISCEIQVIMHQGHQIHPTSQESLVIKKKHKSQEFRNKNSVNKLRKVNNSTQKYKPEVGQLIKDVNKGQAGRRKSSLDNSSRTSTKARTGKVGGHRGTPHIVA